MRFADATRVTSLLLGAALFLSAAPGNVFSALLPATQTKSQPQTKSSTAKSTPKTSATSKQSTPSSKAKKPTKSRASSRARRQNAPTPDRIREIQSALAEAGHYAGAPTGKWDAQSAEAMKRFQSAHGLNPSGKLDAKSLQKLGLGSQVAGLAPPRTSASQSPPR